MLKKPLLLLLETATGVCSVALSEGERLLTIRTSKEEREHASMLAVYIQEVMTEVGRQLSEIDAVVVSKGPGSYTGLRIGIATAKGICFTLNKPLIAIDTPLAMASAYWHERKNELPAEAVLVPVIDARRMEVYGAALDMQLEYIEGIRAEVLTPDSFIREKLGPHFVFGDAAAKCVEVFKSESFVKVDTTYNLSALGLLYPGLLAFSQQKFEDIAYFEPHYLKEFVAKVKQG
ncbi:MAG: tRNA (adenosine(37)-N6)-threonylcarbamoyltransferase complex dimerization subunit type 1 TsaB [Bacteroidetes bacterium]|nr:tRNA (adenosine(37)-N6)-threonylcarbamoyltransferase complex dimerization subunit type 1 TsaB [Bacteroidota bacterium]